MEALIHQSITFSKAKTKYCSSLHYNHDNSYLFINGKSISLNLIKNVPLSFAYKAYLINLNMSEKVSFKANAFSVDYSAIDKSDILNIHKYLVFKNNIN